MGRMGPEGPFLDVVQDATGLLLAARLGLRDEALSALDGLRGLCVVGGELERVVEGMPVAPRPAAPGVDDGNDVDEVGW